MTEIPDRFQVRVAQVALSVAEKHGFALGGGHALLAHGLVHRPTEDIDLFTDVDGSVRAATDLVRSALTEAGLRVSAPPAISSDLTDAIEGMEDALEELEVSDGSATVSVSLAQLARHRAPIVMAIGPVLHLDDVLGSKVCALGTRAPIGCGYDRARLIDMAHEHDPALAEEDLEFAMKRLDRMPDAVFAPYRLDTAAVSELRRQFADRPR
jgi:Nucleotidyl transferase AbiEii toxin, Type IV TA system